MSTFIEVFSLEKQCKVVLNLDKIIEIAPIAAGGCALFFEDSAAVGGKTAYKVSDSYAVFQQFALQPVSLESMAAKVRSLKSPTTNTGQAA
jgi:hypothetical protein